MATEAEPAAGRTSAVRDWASGCLDEIVDDLAVLVDTETPSTDPVLLAAGAAVLTGWVLETWTGSTATTLGAGPGAVLQVDAPGSRDGTVVLLGHLDTVFEAGTVAARPFTVTDGVARGPGVFDMKAGLVVGVYAVAALDALGVARPSVRLLVNADEEVGSLGSRSSLVDAAAGAEAVLVLEPGAVAGTVKTARKGVGLWTVTATGVGAHAGLDPEAGASAVHALAALTSYLAGLADPAAGTTVNVGVLTGGTRPNVVADHARMEIDVRARTDAEAARVTAALAAWRPADPRVRIEIAGGWNRPPWSTPAPGMVARAEAVLASLGVAVDPREVGGASDGNILAAAGLPVLDGLGASGGGAHAEHEHVVVADLPVRIALLAGLIAPDGS
ncbi:M20/M25/M40 family metallo-hydrolase [Actinomycetospora straminea]|uniref:M20 family metallopeptidase n=1 Tax=Actinomycetospora straminea TaxID=663607 RepID=A0ABP9EQL9_9PSEU|nr:M20/M25/M40 family metallo-hydrolase [Actinomycetospora straminea]MDD7933936.1 M20/M25/M40 family metallo-hydrolase [Actinomycetospora straminea]